MKNNKNVSDFIYTVLTEDEEEYCANFISRTGNLRGVKPCAVIKDKQNTYYSYCADKMQEIDVAEGLLVEFNIIFCRLDVKVLLKIFEKIIGKKVLGVIIKGV